MITHVACKIKGEVYSLPKPNRHHNIIWTLAAIDPSWRQAEGDIQGFLDDQGNFLDRTQALAHALQERQHKTPDNHFPQLYSEDLW